MIKSIDNYDQEIIAQVLGSSTNRLNATIRKLFCELCTLCQYAFTLLLLSHSVCILSRAYFSSLGSSQPKGCCVHVHTHTHAHKDFPALQLPGCSRLLRSFIPFPHSTFWCVACTILPHELTRLSATRVSWAANYSQDVRVIRIVQPAGRLSFTELKATQSLLKGLVWTDAVTFQPYF